MEMQRVKDAEVRRIGPPDGPPQDGGDLSRLVSGMEAIRERLGYLNARLSYLYGDGEVSDPAHPQPGGLIGKLQALLEDISSELSRAENTVEGL